MPYSDMRVHSGGLFDELGDEDWCEDRWGDSDLADELLIPDDFGPATFLSRVWSVGRAVRVDGEWQLTWIEWCTKPAAARAALVGRLEEFRELAVCADDERTVMSIEVALERLERRQAMPAGDCVVVASNAFWWYWPELAGRLDASEACRVLTQRLGEAYR